MMQFKLYAKGHVEEQLFHKICALKKKKKNTEPRIIVCM